MSKGGEKRVVCVHWGFACRRRSRHDGSNVREIDRQNSAEKEIDIYIERALRKRKRDEWRSVRGGGKRERPENTTVDEMEWNKESIGVEASPSQLP